MLHPHARLGAIIALTLATTLVATACSSASDDASESAPSTTASPDEPQTDVDAEPEAETAAPLEVPTCDNLIAEGVAADFTELGWSAKTETFYLGNIAITDGVQCVWADYVEGELSDQLQIFGGALITAEDAAADQAALEAEGWVREESAEGVYITENPETAFAPVDGYGITYFFGDGYVQLSDTKQGLLLIDWPKAP
ncbi:hypothetical protein ACWPKO_19685 (plasmid) [Coraliomargarita sp. W4R53]